MFGAISYLPTYLQIVTGVSATTSGLLLLPPIGGLLVTSISSGRLITRTGHYKAYPVAGTALAAAGLYLLSRMGVRTSHLASSVYLLGLGLGLGLFLQVIVLIAQNSAARRDLGAATASVNFARQIGSSIGVALTEALFIHRLDGQLSAHLPASGGRPPERSAGQLDHAAGPRPAACPAQARHRPGIRPRPPASLRVPDPAAGRGVLARADPQGDPAAHPRPAGCGTGRPRAAGSTPPGRCSHQPRHVPAAGRPHRKSRPHPPRSAAPACRVNPASLLTVLVDSA